MSFSCEFEKRLKTWLLNAQTEGISQLSTSRRQFLIFAKFSLAALHFANARRCTREIRCSCVLLHGGGRRKNVSRLIISASKYCHIGVIKLLFLRENHKGNIFDLLHILPSLNNCTNLDHVFFCRQPTPIMRRPSTTRPTARSEWEGSQDRHPLKLWVRLKIIKENIFECKLSSCSSRWHRKGARA